MVDPLPWTEKFKIGVEALDDDHRALVDLINVFIQTAHNPDSRGELPIVFRRIVERTQAHFERENEFVMVNDTISGKAHILEHDRLLDSLRKIGQEMVTAESGADMHRICAELKDWFIRHAIEFDAAMRAQFYDYKR